MNRLKAIVGAVFFSLSLLSIATHASAAGGKLIKSQNAIEGQYIVVLHDQPDKKAVATDYASVTAQNFAVKHNVQVTNVFQYALSGFSINATEAQARSIANEPGVEYVVEDNVMSVSVTQTPATWGLDRVDQRSRPINNSYIYEQTGAGVHVYVIDTGIRATHNEFGGRVALNYTAINDGRGASDCNGHGTHVAGTIGGSTWGVAKSVQLHSVRVLDCSGSGYTSGVIAGVDWVTAHHVSPAVANMSLGGGANRALDDAVTRSINSGVTYSIAAGNWNANACNYSPARTAAAITVGATTNGDARASYSDYGRCLDIFAPGSNITSAWWTSDTATNTISGTSMAAPHVAGIAALYLQTNNSASPATVTYALESMMTYGKISNVGSGSPNNFIYSRHSTYRRGAFFRYYNSGSGDHFYTMNWNELSAAGFSRWNYEGVQGYIVNHQVANSIPLYRYYNTRNGDHFYTTNWGELGGAGSNGWVYEGIAGYVPTVAASDTANLYRYFNTRSGDHFYTTNWGELGGGGFGGWVYEGIQCLIYTTP